MSESFRGDSFERVVYFGHDASGTGNSKDDRLPLVSKADAMQANPGEVIEAAQVVIEEALAGTTAVDVGDGVDPDGYVAAASVTVGAAGAYAGAGALLPDYAPAAKDLAVAFAGASSAGKMAVMVRGYRI